MRVRVDKIIVRRRLRKELEDIESLMESMRKYGQLCPIIINSHNELLAGERRLTAAIRLGWPTIEAIVLDKDDELEMLEIELEENLARANLSNSEIDEGLKRLAKLRNPSIFRRILNFFKRLFRKIFKKRRHW